jgi:hypothetical protein
MCMCVCACVYVRASVRESTWRGVSSEPTTYQLAKLFEHGTLNDSLLVEPRCHFFKVNNVPENAHRYTA